jgi:hypothetical protein
VAVQSWHKAPRLPQALSEPPIMHVPVESQHPVQYEAHGIPASRGALQIVTMMVGACGMGPHVSPRMKHSAALAQSWTAPIGVDEGQGAFWHTVLMMPVAQQT